MIRFAGFGRRAWALIASLLIDAVVYGLLAAITHGNAATPFLGWLALHHIGFVAEGGSLGHRIAGLRVVRVDGTRLGFGRAALRLLAWIGMSLPPLGLGFLWMLDEEHRRAWHDIVAGSVVVRESVPAELQPAPAWADAPPWQNATAAAPDAAGEQGVAAGAAADEARHTAAD